MTIVIVLALLAFIMGDAFSGQGNRNPVVGTIDGVKVNYTDFIDERLRQESMIQGSGEQAQEEAYNRAWSELISKNALIPGFQKLGLGLSEAEQADMVSGVGGGYISPVMEQYFRNPETGAFDPQMMAYFVQNMTPNDHAMWQMILAQAKDERLFSKYGTLVANGLYVTANEVEQAMGAESKSYDARIVFKPYSSIADSTVSVPESDIKAYYNAHQEKYRRGASRDMEYVVFDIVPSAADMEDGAKRADELAAQFAAAADPAIYAQLNSEDKTPSAFVREEMVAAPVLAAVANGEMYGPVLEGETYTMARLAERRMLPDSVTFGVILLAGDDTPLADSLMGVANHSNFAELARQFSVDRQSEMADGAPVTIDPMMMPAELSDALIATPAGRMAKAENSGYIFIIDVISKSAPVAKVKVATLKYTVPASPATHAEATSRARDFYAKASEIGFDKAVSEMALPKRTAHMANTDRAVEGLDNSLQMIRWAFDSKKGAIMEPEELTRDYIVVAALTRVTEAGIAPLEDVKAQIRSLLVQRRKGDMLAESMAGTSVDAIAEAQGLDVVEAGGLQFSAFSISGLGFEPRLVGAICATTEAGRVSKPVKGTNGVYVFEVANIVSGENDGAEGMRVRMESMQEYMMNSALMNALYEKSNVVDNRVKYF